MITRKNIFTGFEVECDMCGKVERGVPENNKIRDTVKSVTEYMRSIGWVIGNGKNVCAECRSKRKCGKMRKYRLVFTHIRRGNKVEEEVTEDNRHNRVKSMVDDGYMLSEVKHIGWVKP